MSASKASRAGFTLIELLVVCAIIIVVSTIVLIDNNKFGGDITLENFSYSVALSVRQAQVYGIAVERFGTNCTTGATSACFSSGYGMHFSLATPTTYILFADEDGTGVYDAQRSPSEVVQSNSITQGFAITGLCVIANTSRNSTCQPVNQIDILYIRPEPEAYITAKGSPYSCKLNPRTDCNYEAQITLTSPKGDTRSVVVDATGQISVQLQ
jgi:prepilin-type N-terminal cleavage/methylation domain-containing protein